MATTRESEHVLELSRELLDDIELGRLNADKLLLKCSRLARLAGSEEIRKWLQFEMQGFSSNDPVALLYMSRTGRWTNRTENKGYWGPLAQQEASIEAQKAQLAASKLDSISGDLTVLSLRNLSAIQSSITSNISTLSGIRSRVLGLLHTFVTGVYYEREFANLVESTFEKYKKNVDALISQHAGDVLSKIPAVISRLQEGEEEAISQALTTCRRILEAFADAIYPASGETVELGGNTLKLDASKHQNRLNAYIASRTESTSRRVKLRQNLSNLFDRVSSGVHKDVTSEEAFALFLNVYLFLGEVLHLGKQPLAEIGQT